MGEDRAAFGEPIRTGLCEPIQTQLGLKAHLLQLCRNGRACRTETTNLLQLQPEMIQEGNDRRHGRLGIKDALGERA
jgi:hypothetical protein